MCIILQQSVCPYEPSMEGSQYSAKAERLLHAPDVIRFPVLLRDLLLTHRHPFPLHPHIRYGIDIILIKLDAQC